MSKVKDLPEITTLDDEDLIYVVDDSEGTNGGRKIKKSNLEATLSPAPAVHGDTHTETASDPVPNSTSLEGGLHSAVDKARAEAMIFTSTFGRLTSGGGLSAGAGLNLNFGSGTGIVNNGLGVPTLMSWSSGSISLTDNDEKLIVVNSTGTVSTATFATVIAANAGHAVIGRAKTSNGAIIFIDEVTNDAEHRGNKLLGSFAQAIGAVYLNGSNVTENVTARHLDISPGSYVLGINSFQPSGGFSNTFFESTRLGGQTYTATQEINNTQYDASGVLTNIPAGEFRKDTLWVVGEGSLETYLLVMGQETFPSIIEAEKGSLPIPPTSFVFGVARIASIIIQEGQDNIQDIMDARPIIGSEPQGTTPANVHGNLLNLDADDHTQYLNISGIRAMTGNLDLGVNDILNAGLIDGRDVSTDGAALDGHLDGGVNKHDAIEVDYERLDGSKTDIQASSDDVEAALSDLDDNKLSTSDTDVIANTAHRSSDGSDHSLIATHASRHLPSGADPLTTAIPVSVGTANGLGAAEAFAKSDHIHAHGIQTDGTLHSDATPSTDGFMSAADKTKLDNLDKSYIQYTNNAIQSTSSTSFQSINFQTDRMSSLGAAFTKVNATDFRIDFDGTVKIILQVTNDVDLGDRGLELGIQQNLSDIVWARARNSSKSDADRVNSSTVILLLVVADGDIIRGRFRSLEGVLVSLPIDFAHMIIEIFNKD